MCLKELTFSLVLIILNSPNPPTSCSSFSLLYILLCDRSPPLLEGKLSAVENTNCICRTPCNMTRYNKELSMVKIPSKTSARYLEKKFNKSEKYIT